MSNSFFNLVIISSGLLNKCQEKDIECPITLDVVKKRYDPAYRDAYCAFLDYFIGSVVGKFAFSDRCYREPLGDYVNVSDEAFTILVFENNYERWHAMFENNNNWKHSDVLPKWTNGDNSNRKLNKGKISDQNGSSAKMRGWNFLALQRYNQLCEEIYFERYWGDVDEKMDLFAEFEQVFLRYKNAQLEDAKKGKANGLVKICDVPVEECFHTVGGTNPFLSKIEQRRREYLMHKGVSIENKEIEAVTSTKFEELDDDNMDIDFHGSGLPKNDGNYVLSPDDIVSALPHPDHVYSNTKLG